jgi:hypothetical protein
VFDHGLPISRGRILVIDGFIAEYQGSVRFSCRPSQGGSETN